MKYNSQVSSSPEPRALEERAYWMVASVDRRLSTFSKDFFSEINRPISIKCLRQPPQAKGERKFMY